MTGRRMHKLLFASALALIATAAMAPASQATSHDIRVRALLDNGDASYIELQMTSDGQNLTDPRTVDIYNATATLGMNPGPFQQINLTDVGVGINQHTILIGDTTVLGRDFTDTNLDAELLNAGAVCYDDIDCVSWGAFTGNANLPSSAGAPATGVSATQALVRTIAPNCATLLENADDTNNSLGDFSLVTGFPVRANADAPTETPCPPAPSPSPGLGNPTSNINPAGHVRKRKCKKKHRSASAAKKKCKKK